MQHQLIIPADLAEQFSQSLTAALALIAQLETLLCAEAQVITRRDSVALHQVVTDKRTLVAALETETVKHKQWVAAAHLPFTSAGLAAFFAACSTAPQLSAQWAQLREAGVRCNQLNRANAHLIEHDRRRVTMLLRILKGDDVGTATYTPQGRTSSAGLRSRTLIHA